MGQVFKIIGRGFNLARLLKNDRGNVAVMFAVCATTLGIGVGAAIDTSRLVSNDQMLQDALDAATLRVANLPISIDIQSEGVALLGDNMNSSEILNLTASFSRSGDQVIATANGDVSLEFRGFIGRPLSGVTATTVVNIVSNPPCITALSQTQSPGLLLNSGATITSSSCEVHVHSEATPALTVNAGTDLNPAKTCVAGHNITNHSSNVEGIETECDVATDPYEGQIPVVASSVCEHNSQVHEGGVITLSPGTYCGVHNFQGGNLEIVMQPGLYVIRNGGWNINGGQMRGDGVTFYFADESGVQFNSAVQAKMTPPETGLYAGIFMAEAPNLSHSQFVINDSFGFDFEGVIYLPSRELVLNSGATVRSRELALVADTIIINGAELNVEPIGGAGSLTASNYISR